MSTPHDEGYAAFMAHEPYDPPSKYLGQPPLIGGAASEWCRAWLRAAKESGMSQAEIEIASGVDDID